MIQFLASIAPALAITLMNNPYLTLILFIVLGQGHFVITYLYQWRAGLITRRYILYYVLIGGLMFLFVSSVSPGIILLVTALVFSIHYYFDEARILIGNNNDVSLLILAPPIAVFNAYFLYREFNIDIFLSIFVISLILLCFTVYRFGIQILLRKDVLGIHLSTLILAYIYLQNILVPNELILGAIIIHHYCTWYVYQYLRLRSSVNRFGTYITDVLLINVVIICFFVLYTEGIGRGYLSYFFEPTYFYGWTLMHIIFTAPTLLSVIKFRFNNFTSTI